MLVPRAGCPLVVSRLCFYVAGGGGEEEHASGAGLPQRRPERREACRHAEAVRLFEGLWTCCCERGCY